MKNVMIMVLVTMGLIGCAKDSSNPPVQQQTVTSTTFVSDSTNDVRLQGVVLDMRTFPLNTEVDVVDMLGCTGLALGNNNSVQDVGVAEGSLLVESSDGKSGKIRFGHMPYLDTSTVPATQDPVCRLFSAESFNFQVSNGKLVLSAIAPGKAWDGAQSTFTAQ